MYLHQFLHYLHPGNTSLIKSGGIRRTGSSIVKYCMKYLHSFKTLEHEFALGGSSEDSGGILVYFLVNSDLIEKFKHRTMFGRNIFYTILRFPYRNCN